MYEFIVGPDRQSGVWYVWFQCEPEEMPNGDFLRSEELWFKGEIEEVGAYLADLAENFGPLKIWSPDRSKCYTVSMAG